MRLLRHLFALSVFCVIPIQSQTISMDEAIKMALNNNPELQKQQNELRKADVELNESLRIPNPTISYSREDLTNNSNNVGEWAATGSLPINFLWDRWSNINSKEKYLEAQQLLYESSKLGIVYRVKATYTKYHLYKELSKQFADAYEKLDKLAATSMNRVIAGDISEYESQRILVEVFKLKTELKEIEIERNDVHNSLKLLIGYEADAEISTLSIQAHQIISRTENELLQTAIKNRYDLKAIELLIESEASHLSFNRLKAIPNINLTAGYKKQFDNFSGSVFQLNFEVPLFKRNQLEIEKTESQRNYLEKMKVNLIRQINSEVQSTYPKYKQYSYLLSVQSSSQLQNILTSAAYSYEQGDISLVEFIDGLNAYKDGMKLFNDLQIKYYKSLFELENVTAFTNISENKQGE